MVKPYASFNEKLTQFFKFLYFDFYLNIFTFIFFYRKARREAKQARMLAYQADQGMPSMHTECHDTTVWNFMISEETFNISFSKSYIKQFLFGFFLLLLLLLKSLEIK